MIVLHDSKPSEGSLCDVLALVCIFFPVASFVATDGIALYAYLTLVHPRTRKGCCANHSGRIMPIFIAFCLLIPAICTLAIGAVHAEGYDKDFSNTCWIQGKYSKGVKFEYHLLGGKAVEWFSFAFVLCCYVPTVWKLSSVLKQGRAVHRPQSREIRRCVVFLYIVRFVVTTPCT